MVPIDGNGIDLSLSLNPSLEGRDGLTFPRD
jgi:hypothetical protein